MDGVELWDGKPDRWILTIEPRAKFGHIQLLGPPVLVWFHWKDRDVFCLGNVGQLCPHCPDVGRRRKGFAPGRVWYGTDQDGNHKVQERIIPLTEKCLQQLAGVELRGLWISMERAGPRKNDPVRLTILNPQPPTKRELPGEWDPMPLLFKTWGVAAIKAAIKEHAEEPDVIPFRKAVNE